MTFPEGSPTLAGWWVAICIAFALSVFVVTLVRRHRQMPVASCRTCGYSREGLQTDACPECGCVWEGKPTLFRRIQIWQMAAIVVIGATGWVALSKWIAVRERGAVALMPTWALIEVFDSNPLSLHRIGDDGGRLSRELDLRMFRFGLDDASSRRLGERIASAWRGQLRMDSPNGRITAEYVDLSELIRARSVEAIASGRDPSFRSRTCWSKDLIADPHWMEWSGRVVSDVRFDLRFVKPLIDGRRCEFHDAPKGLIVEAEPEVQAIVRRAVNDLLALEGMSKRADGGIELFMGPVQRDPTGREWVTVLINADEPARLTTEGTTLSPRMATDKFGSGAEYALTRAAGGGGFQGSVVPINSKLALLIEPKDIPSLREWWNRVLEYSTKFSF